MSTKKSSNYQRIYDTVRRIPEGRVANYGQIAAIAGLPGHARQVGYALAALPDELSEEVPWQRVINAKGEVSPRSEPGREGLQRAILEHEGIEFSEANRVDWKRFRWRPD